MSDTVDPRAALRDGDVSERASAARTLARTGGWLDLEELVRMAKEDPSASVRLYAAGAAADIALRARRAGELGRDREAQVLDWVRAFDPDVNPSLLMLLSAVASGPALDRLGRMLRDPRNGVRAGAATALRRAALSAASDEVPLAQAAGALLANRKMPADALLELVKIVGEAGWDELTDAVRAASAAGRLHAPAAEEALQRLALRRDPGTWEGLWLSDGSDVYETGDERPVEDWLAVVDGCAWGRAGALGELELDRGRGRAGDLRLRIVWAPRAGAPEPSPALQGGGRTWYRADAKSLVACVEDLADDLSAPAASAALRELASLDGVQAQRARAILAWRAGDLRRASELLEALLDAPKPRADLFWYLARVRLDQGRREEAREALDRFLDQAGRRARHRKEAEELRSGLD